MPTMNQSLEVSDVLSTSTRGRVGIQGNLGTVQLQGQRLRCSVLGFVSVSRHVTPPPLQPTPHFTTPAERSESGPGSQGSGGRRPPEFF